MKRRDFLRFTGIACAGLAFPKVGNLLAERLPSDGWRTFELTTHVEVLKPLGVTRVWLPAALTQSTPFQRTFSNKLTADGGTAELVEPEERNIDGLGIVAATFPAGVRPVVTLTSRAATRNYVVDPLIAGHNPHVSKTARHGAPAPKADAAELQHFLRPTRLLPTDGIVQSTAAEITRGARTEVEKARAIYEWIVDNTFRNPKTRGCGLGDIRWMLQSGDLGGKCADLNALYVGLARAAGLPARDVYGIRVAKSELGYKSLGVSTENVTKAQHCRAEVYLNGHGWVPVDPADVRKVVLEEPPGNRPLDDDLVKGARGRLFGSWEMNWIAYNFAHDVVLPGSSGSPVAFLMYPQAETSNGRLDSLDPDNFKYEITAKEISSPL